MSEYIVRGAVPNHTVRVEDEREVYWHMTHLPVLEEIVRCRDCEHYHDKFNGCDEFGDMWHDEYANVEPDGFCAWGERRTR